MAHVIAVHFTLFFVTQFFMVKIPQILLPESILPFGWDAMLTIYFFAGYFYNLRLVKAEDFTLRDIFKFVIVTCFWCTFINWKDVLFSRRRRVD